MIDIETPETPKRMQKETPFNLDIEADLTPSRKAGIDPLERAKNNFSNLSHDKDNEAIHKSFKSSRRNWNVARDKDPN